ncbi:MAG: hypothetical protein ACREQM_07565 [Candidatus Dormibacteraceae bacterium]
MAREILSALAGGPKSIAEVLFQVRRRTRFGGPSIGWFFGELDRLADAGYLTGAAGNRWSAGPIAAVTAGAGRRSRVRRRRIRALLTARSFQVEVQIEASEIDAEHPGGPFA